ncbi:hypothetical protein ABK040_005523 [Willaertia magna]
MKLLAVLFLLLFFYLMILTEQQQEDQCFSTILNPSEFSQLPPATYQDIVTCSFGYSKVIYNETIICDSYNNIFIEKEGKYCLDTNDCIISSFGTFFSCVNNKCTFSKTRVLGDDCLENENCLEGICWNGKCSNNAGFNNENNKPVLKLGQDCPQNQMDESNLICERSLDCVAGKCVSVKKVGPYENCDASYNDFEFIPPTVDLLTRNYSLNLCEINYSCLSGFCVPFYYFNENEVCDSIQTGQSFEVCKKFGWICQENYIDFRKRCFPYDYSFFKSIGSSCDSTDECQQFIPNVECFKGKCVANSLKEGEYCESNYHCASELCVENRCIKLLDNDTFCDINNGCKNPNNVCTCGGKLMESGKGRCLDVNCNKFKYELASCLSYFPDLQNIMMLLRYNQIIVDPKSSIFKKYCNQEFIRYYSCLKQSQNNAYFQTTDIPGFLQLDNIDLQNYKLTKKDNNYNLNVTEPLLSNITYFQIPEMNTTTHTIVNSLNRLLVMTINPKITNVTVSNNDFVGCTCCNEDVLRMFQNAQEYYNKTNTVKFKSGVRLQKYEPVMGHSSFIYRNWQQCEYIVAPPSEVDGLALAIKNNLLLLNDEWTVEQINNLKMSDIFSKIEFHHISYNYQIIPKFIRQYENLSNQVLNNITIEVKKDLDYVENIYKKLNTTKLSLKEIKKYHDKITNYNFGLSFMELIYLQFFYSNIRQNVTDLIQYDNWFLQNAFIKNDYANNYTFIQEILSSSEMIDKIFVPIETFGGYNSYLGVFHYSDVNQFGLLILKDALLYFIIVLGTLFYIGIILLYKKSLSLKRRLFIPFIGPLCIILLCIPYLEPILLRFHKQLKMKAHIYHLIPIPNGLMSILIGTYMVMVLRFIYLRNLYTIVEKFKYIKFHKILSSKIAAFVLLIISAILIFGAWFGIYFGIMSAILTKSDGSFEWSLQFDATIISLTTQIAFLSFISITCLVIDAIISRKTIKLKGLRYYLFFDDPFFLRIDLFIMVVMIIVAIIILLDILIWETLIINRIFLAIFFILCYMVLGGTIIFSEIINFIFKKEKETNESKMQLENYMEDYNFRELFKQYCINEYSLENYLFYEFLENLEKKKEITNQDINYLQETFLDRHAQYEVNFPGVTIRKYKALIESINIENELIPYEKFDEIFKQEILRNLIDTLGRLEQTKEYKKWFATKSIQIENEL